MTANGLIESTKVIIAIIMANKIEGSEIFDVPSQPKGWQATGLLTCKAPAEHYIAGFSCEPMRAEVVMHRRRQWWQA